MIDLTPQWLACYTRMIHYRKDVMSKKVMVNMNESIVNW